MVEFLSEQELERISEFASTPKYERDPEQLVPDGAESEQFGRADDED